MTDSNGALLQSFVYEFHEHKVTSPGAYEVKIKLHVSGLVNELQV